MSSRALYVIQGSISSLGYKSKSKSLINNEGLRKQELSIYRYDICIFSINSKMVRLLTTFPQSDQHHTERSLPSFLTVEKLHNIYKVHTVIQYNIPVSLYHS